MRIKPVLHSAVVFTFLVLALLGIAQEGEQGNAQRVRIGFVGDTFLGNWAVAYLDTHGVSYPYQGTRHLFEEMDLVVANLESPITTSDSAFVEKTYLLKSPPGIEKGLYEANIRAVNLANNHILDRGVHALQETMNYLDRANVKHFGGGMNKEEAIREAVMDINGVKVALLGFAAIFPEEFWAGIDRPGVPFPYREDVIEAVERCVRENDLVIVSFHWSAELRPDPKDYQVELAELCIDLGVDAVIGHHPHIPQSVAVYKGKPIFYSVGNFAFASYSTSAKVGLLADIVFEGEEVISARVIPLNVFNEEVNFNPYPLPQEKAAKFFTYLDSLSVPFNDSLSIIDQNGNLDLTKR